MGLGETLNAEQLKALANNVGSLLDHPEVGIELKRVVSKGLPHIKFTEVEAEKVVLPVVAKLEKEITELKAASQKDMAERNYKELKASVVKKGVIKENEIPDVEKIMTDKGINNFETAAEFYSAQRQIAPATAEQKQSRTSLQMPDSQTGLFKNPAKWARETAQQALSEIEQQRAARTMVSA